LAAWGAVGALGSGTALWCTLGFAVGFAVDVGLKYALGYAFDFPLATLLAFKLLGAVVVMEIGTPAPMGTHQAMLPNEGTRLAVGTVGVLVALGALATWVAVECEVNQRVHLSHQKNLRSATIFSLGSRGPGGVVFHERGPLLNGGFRCCPSALPFDAKFLPPPAATAAFGQLGTLTLPVANLATVVARL
jgi:hypothetical protein